MSGEQVTLSPNRKERRHARTVSAISVVAAITALAACSSKNSGSAEPPAASTVSATASIDLRAYQCDVSPNPYPGTTEECSIPDGGIKKNGVPTFRYTNLSSPSARIPYSISEPTYVDCRIPDDKLPGSFASLNGGGEYILGGPYGGSAVVAANNFYNPTVAPNEKPFDPAVKFCAEAAIRAVTPPGN